jgi:hypothetical protein
MSHQRYTFRNAEWQFPRGEIDEFHWTADKEKAISDGRLSGAVAVCTFELQPNGKWAVVKDEPIVTRD